MPKAKIFPVDPQKRVKRKIRRKLATYLRGGDLSEDSLLLLGEVSLHAGVEVAVEQLDLQVGVDRLEGAEEALLNLIHVAHDHRGEEDGLGRKKC